MATRTRLLAALLLLFCAVAGFAAGIIADRAYLISHGRVLPAGGVEFVTRHLVHRLDRSLDLTDAQEAEVRRILDRRRERIMGEWRGLHDRFHHEIGQAHKEIETVLTPEQRVRYEKMRRHWANQHRRWLD